MPVKADAFTHCLVDGHSGSVFVLSWGNNMIGYCCGFSPGCLLRNRTFCPLFVLLIVITEDDCLGGGVFWGLCLIVSGCVGILRCHLFTGFIHRL